MDVISTIDNDSNELNIYHTMHEMHYIEL